MMKIPANAAARNVSKNGYIKPFFGKTRELAISFRHCLSERARAAEPAQG